MNQRPPGYELPSVSPSAAAQCFPGLLRPEIAQNPKVVPLRSTAIFSDLGQSLGQVTPAFSEGDQPFVTLGTWSTGDQSAICPPMIVTDCRFSKLRRGEISVIYSATRVSSRNSFQFSMADKFVTVGVAVIWLLMPPWAYRVKDCNLVSPAKRCQVCRFHIETQPRQICQIFQRLQRGKRSLRGVPHSRWRGISRFVRFSSGARSCHMGTQIQASPERSVPPERRFHRGPWIHAPHREPQRSPSLVRVSSPSRLVYVALCPRQL